MFLVIGGVLFFVYFYFIKGDKEEEGNLSSSSTLPLAPVDKNSAVDNIVVVDDQLSQQILATLSSIKSISLDDSMFNSPAFNSLIDGTYPLVPTKDEGRPNPFAPIGDDVSNSFNSNSLNTFQTPALNLEETVPVISGTPTSLPNSLTTN